VIDRSAFDKRQEALNAFVDIDESAKSGSGELADITVAIKSNIAVRGLPWSAGLEAFRRRIAEEDATTVRALRNAGATIVGTVGMEEGALGSKTDNPFFGAVQNPHRLGYSPGGSSGGSAAAVAAEMVDAALGTDTMGSVRIPASHCGIYGFKPATDAVSQDGLEPADLTLDAIGPMARDLGLLERIASTMSRMGSTEIISSGAVLVDHGVEVQSDVAAVFRNAVSKLSIKPAEVRLSHPCSRVRYAGFIHVSRAMATQLRDVEHLSQHLQKLLTYGPERAPEKYAQDAEILETTRAEMRAIVRQNGFLVMPTVPNTAFPHSQDEPAAQADFTCLANVAGLPAITIPAGWSDDGLPIGVQLVGPIGSEAALFAKATQLDRCLNAYRSPANF